MNTNRESTDRVDSMDTEARLRSALSGLAGTVHDAPDAYRRAQQQWRRRDLKRRVTTVAIILIVVAVACGAGIWALSGASPGRHVIFDGNGDVDGRHAPNIFPPGSP
ncbi:hypothetical protein ACGFOM_37790 [Streptomyces sp. NPDC048594]|uniref:hypothetical protein n=1 Tax=Streptomyces sp. NPDC048594 TaxID=3365575 RepID=UPI00371D68B7